MLRRSKHQANQYVESFIQTHNAACREAVSRLSPVLCILLFLLFFFRV